MLLHRLRRVNFCISPKIHLARKRDFQNPRHALSFPKEELGTYDLVAVRFVSVATTRGEWGLAIDSILTLLKPGGYLQWIDSCNVNLYNSVAGTSRAANQEMFGAWGASFQSREDLVIGMMIRDAGPVSRVREAVLNERGLKDVHEDVFASDRLPEMRDVGSKNMIMCWKQALEDLVKLGGTGWTEERVEKVCEEAFKEIDAGLYHSLDQVCIIGRKP